MECDKSQCSSCSQDCAERKVDFHEPCNEFSSIKKVISVMSGKGGVGKSLVTSLLASSFQKKGMKVGILDADITGPSIPKIFGLKQKAEETSFGICPVETPSGIKIMSVNLILEDEDAPVIWRGPMLALSLIPIY